MNEYCKQYLMLKKRNLELILAKEKTVTAVAKEMGVSRKTVHKWKCRYFRWGSESLYTVRRKKYPSAHNRTSPALESCVIRIAEEYWWDGVQTLCDRLSVEEIYLHPSTIYRILKRRGIRYDILWAGTRKRKKKQLYAHKEAGKELQMDTKYPFGYKQGKVAYTVIDDATRWSYAKLYRTANAENTVDFLKELMKRSPFDIQKIRMDNGTEFIAHRVQNYIKDQNIETRYNTPYCPQENGKIERFHRTMNEKSISLFWSPQDSMENLQYKLSQFLHWYNYEKRHRGLGMDGLTPVQKLTALQNKSVTLTLQCNTA